MTDWFHAANGTQQVGPVSAEQLAALFGSGEITAATLVWREGLDNWLPLRRVFDELGLREAPAAAVVTEPEFEPAAVDPEPPPVPPAPRAAVAASPFPSAETPTASVPAPRPKGMSGCLIAVIVVAVLAVPMIAILAAIAIPAYHDYLQRSQAGAAVAEARAAVGLLEPEIVDFKSSNGTCPENASDGFKPAEDYAGVHVASIKIGHFENGNCGVEVALRGSGSATVDGKKLWMERVGDGWKCTSEIENKLLPANCRGD